MPAGGSVPAGESVKVIGWLSERERLRESSGESVKVLGWLSERGVVWRVSAGNLWDVAGTLPGRCRDEVQFASKLLTLILFIGLIVKS